MFFRFIFLIFFCLINILYADITLEGYLHPGYTQSSTYTPADPLTNDTDAEYDYYVDNPSKFYLSEDSELTGIELVNAVDIDSDSNIRVYIDDELIETGADGSATVNFSTLSLGSGYHTIAVSGSCYDRRGREVDCSNRNVRSIDDFSFSAISLKTDQSTVASNFIDRVHLGDNSDDDDNYDIDDSSWSLYPDDNEGTSKEYSVNSSQQFAGFRVFIARVRDVYADGINKIEVYDNDNALITTFDLNTSSSYKFDYSALYSGDVNGISKVKVISGKASSSDYDDISFGELIVIPYTSTADMYPKPLVNYRMDECSWDGSSGDVQDSSINANSATSGNDANTTDGKLCRAGDINATDTSDKYILAQDGISLPEEYTLTVWVNFPLNEDGHKTFSTSSGGWFGGSTTNDLYFNIADLSGSDSDYIYFRKEDDDWSLCMYGSDYECYDYNPQDLSGWHHLAFSVTNDGTIFYVDGNEELDFDEHPNNVDLALLFNSDYDSDTDDEPNEQSIGALVDEFKIFDQALSEDDITTIYDNENSGKNYDGTERTCNDCAGDNGEENQNYKFDAWDIWRDINDRNISTKVVSDNFDLLIASLNEDGTAYQEFNGTVCVKIIDKNNNDLSDWEKIYFNDKNSSDQTDDGNPDFNITKSVREGIVNISWKRSVDESCPLENEDNETNATDSFAIRPERFTFDINSSELYAGEDFTIFYKALDAIDANSSDYNTSSGFRIDANKTLPNCGDVTFSLPLFSNGGNRTIENLDTIGDINVTLRDTNDSDSWAAVDSDDTNDSLRLIASRSKIVTIKPYDINITDLNITKSSNDNWLYMAKDIQDMNITLTPTLEVFSKNGVKLQEYNSSCYAEDVNVTFYYDVNRSDDLNLTLDGNLTSSDNSIEDINKTLQIPKERFVKGEANSSYSFGIDRVFDSEKNVSFVTLNELNISSDTSAKYENGLSTEDNTTFYYGQLYTADLSTSKIPDTTTAKVLIYNATDTPEYQEELLHWYIYTPHKESDGNITTLTSSASTTKPSANTDDINATSSYEGDGIFSISVDNPQEKKNTYFIHLDIQNYLWYVPKDFGDDYNESVGSSCLEHPCFEYKYGTNNPENTGVESGETNGLSFELNTSKNSRGVRLYR